MLLQQEIIFNCKNSEKRCSALESVYRKLLVIVSVAHAQYNWVGICSMHMHIHRIDRKLLVNGSYCKLHMRSITVGTKYKRALASREWAVATRDCEQR